MNAHEERYGCELGLKAASRPHIILYFVCVEEPCQRIYEVASVWTR